MVNRSHEHCDFLRMPDLCPDSTRRTRPSIDNAAFLPRLSTVERLLVIQDLDGVCMDLVHDPLTREIELSYLHAARLLDGEFFVLTNGEHIGSRGVNRLVEAACGGLDAAEEGLYLPGLAAGGVQYQDCRGQVDHPGVSEAELAFLAQVPAMASDWLSSVLQAPPFDLSESDRRNLVARCVLDNPVSPTLNLNTAFQALSEQPGAYEFLQHQAAKWCEGLLATAEAAGLGDAFFVHYAPNLGRDAHGERLKPALDGQAGTTDFQFMLRGGVKEVGVLVLLNRYYQRLTGEFPLGEGFNARNAPQGHEALVSLAREAFDPALMPCILGVGDTLTSAPDPDDAARRVRGGSDRGFLTLVQALGDAFGSGNVVAFVDSSAGEIRRPGVRLEYLADAPGRALEGISDAADPLAIDLIFAEGHRQYLRFFGELARLRNVSRREM